MENHGDLHIRLISDPSEKQNKSSNVKTKVIPQTHILDFQNPIFLRKFVMYFVFIIWIIVIRSYSKEIYEAETLILLRIYNTNLKDKNQVFFEWIGKYIEFDISNLLFLILSYLFLNSNYITGFIFTIKVILINNFLTIFQLIFEDKRPFWEIHYELTTSKNCLRTFALPEPQIFNLLTFCYLSMHFFKINSTFVGLFFKVFIIFVNLLLAVSLITDGQTYISQVITTYVMFILIESLVGNSYKYIEKTIEKLLLFKQKSRKSRRKMIYLVFVGIAANLSLTEGSVLERSTNNLTNYVC